APAKSCGGWPARRHRRSRSSNDSTRRHREAAMSATPLLDTELSAYADRQLTPDRMALVDAALARDPALAARVAEIRAQNAALHDALDPMLSERIPQRLLDAACAPKGAASLSRRRWFVTMPVLATAASLVVGI